MGTLNYGFEKSLHAQVLAAKGHRAVLDLPRACHLPDLEMLIYQACLLGPSRLWSCGVSWGACAALHVTGVECQVLSPHQLGRSAECSKHA